MSIKKRIREGDVGCIEVSMIKSAGVHSLRIRSKSCLTKFFSGFSPQDPPKKSGLSLISSLREMYGEKSSVMRKDSTQKIRIKCSSVATGIAVASFFDRNSHIFSNSLLLATKAGWGMNFAIRCLNPTNSLLCRFR